METIDLDKFDYNEIKNKLTQLKNLFDIENKTYQTNYHAHNRNADFLRLKKQIKDEMESEINKLDIVVDFYESIEKYKNIEDFNILTKKEIVMILTNIFRDESTVDLDICKLIKNMIKIKKTYVNWELINVKISSDICEDRLPKITYYKLSYKTPENHIFFQII